jgi:hypothetical protein
MEGMQEFVEKHVKHWSREKYHEETGKKWNKASKCVNFR